jgi:hypothetical protein
MKRENRFIKEAKIVLRFTYETYIDFECPISTKLSLLKISFWLDRTSHSVHEVKHRCQIAANGEQVKRGSHKHIHVSNANHRVLESPYSM